MQAPGATVSVVGFCGAGFVIDLDGTPCTRTLEDFAALERGLDTAPIELHAAPPSLFADRKSRTWLADRLHQYLREVVQHPQASAHPALSHFLGAAANVQLPKSGGLGLALEEDDEAEHHVIVDGFVPIDDAGSPGPAEASDRVRVGDAIVAVSGQSMRGLGYDAVLDCIRQAPDPVSIAFAPAGNNKGNPTPPAGVHAEAVYDGQLSIAVASARGLREVQPHQDPYVVATLGGTGDQRRTQCVYGGGTAPTWGTMHDHELQFALEEPLRPGCDLAVPAVTLEIWNRNMARDELVGASAVHLVAIALPRGVAGELPVDVRIDLEQVLGVDTGGSVDVKISLRGKISAAPAGASLSTSSAAPVTYTIPLLKSGGLGLALEEDDEAEYHVIVNGFVPIDDAGSPGPAEASGRVRVGDAIVAVSGQSMRGLGYDAVLDCIRQAPDPVSMSFIVVASRAADTFGASPCASGTPTISVAVAPPPPPPDGSARGSARCPSDAPNLTDLDAFEAEKQAIEQRHARARELAGSEPAPNHALQDRVTLQVDTSEGLGIMLQEDCAESAEFHVLVDDFVPLEDGTVGPVEASGCVRLGDVVTAVQGQSISGLHYDEVLVCMAAAPNPITLEFGAGSFAAGPLSSVADFLAACGLQDHETGVSRELTYDLGELMEEVLDDFDGVAAKLERAGLDDVEVSTLLVAITDAIGDDDEGEATDNSNESAPTMRAGADAQAEEQEVMGTVQNVQQEPCEAGPQPSSAARPGSSEGDGFSSPAAKSSTPVRARPLLAFGSDHPPRAPPPAWLPLARCAFPAGPERSKGARVEVELDKSGGLGLVLVEDDTNDGVTVVYDFAALAGALLCATGAPVLCACHSDSPVPLATRRRGGGASPGKWENKCGRCCGGGQRRGCLRSRS